jgi:deoxyribonuclease-4
MSIAGGVHKAILSGQKTGCEVIQIFTKSSSQWAARPLPEEEISSFLAAKSDCGIPVIAAHDSYLINLGSPDEALYRKSIGAFRQELERCEQLEIPYLIAHPGAHVGSGESAAIGRIASALNEVHADTETSAVRVLLEITAGQGTTVGHRFEHMARLMERSHQPERLGICFDTCHAHAAGYELRTEEGYTHTLKEFDRIVGIDRIEAFHLNDCKRELGSRVDRHWHIGRGLLGLEPFRLLMNDPRFEGIPGFLETPKGKDGAEDIVNLRVLRRLVGDTGPKPVPVSMKPIHLPGSGRGGKRTVGEPKDRPSGRRSREGASRKGRTTAGAGPSKRRVGGDGLV